MRIDPATPVPDWGLSDVGAARVREAKGSWLSRVGRIVSSAERKAIETAELIAAGRGLQVEIRERMHENDRSATGFLVPAEFEATADLFFARPQESIRGWERAVDAQMRIVAQVAETMAENSEGDVLFVGHGGVGTLLQCHVAGWPVARIRDQRAGGGNVFAFSWRPLSLAHGWRPLEDMARG
ncbi:MAG: histidine phosphatase family protein [Beijerinckiaceae bacterium]